MPIVIDMEIGLSLEIRKEGEKKSFQFIKPSIVVKNIDCEKELAPQLAIAKKAVDVTWDNMSAWMEELIKRELGFSKNAQISTSSTTNKEQMDA